MNKLIAMLYSGLFLIACILAWYVFMHGVAVLEGLLPVFTL